MKTIKLTSPEKPLNIKKLIDSRGKEYYIIINPDDGQDAYFCFEGTVDNEGWNELTNNYEKLSEVVEYREDKRGVYKHVIKLFVVSQEDVIV